MVCISNYLKKGIVGVARVTSCHSHVRGEFLCILLSSFSTHLFFYCQSITECDGQVTLKMFDIRLGSGYETFLYFSGKERQKA